MSNLHAAAIRSEVEAQQEAWAKGHNVDFATASKELLLVAERLDESKPRMQKELELALELKNQAETLRSIMQGTPYSTTLSAVRIAMLRVAAQLETGL